MIQTQRAYRDFCNIETSIPLFSRAWWLDAVCWSDRWSVAVVENNRHEIAASMPFQIKKKWGLVCLTMPRLTQNLGPWISSIQTKPAKKRSKEKNIMNGLLKQIPSYDFFFQNFHNSITNWLPFYWEGYSETTRYTYIIPDLSNLDAIWSGFRDNIRREIRKAERNVDVCDDLSLDTFYALNAMTFERQNTKIPYDFDLVKRIDAAAAERNSRRMFFARDREGRLHAAIYIIWDQNSSYYLMGGADPDLRNSGATSLLMWEAIKFSSTVTKQFDFEGSMIEPIERYFSAFGARQTPYFQVSRMSRRYKFVYSYTRLMKKIMSAVIH